MNNKILLVMLLSMATVCASAQKLSGSLTPLKGQKKVNIVLDFSGTLVNGKSEEKYIAEETKGKSQKEKEEWLADWNEKLRTQAYDKLVNDLNKATSFSVGKYEDAQYTIYVKVIDINTGFFAGVVAKASNIKSEVRFVKTGETSPFATVTFKKSCSPISANVPYYVTRIVMSFGSLGDDIGKAIKKQLKK